MAASRIRPKGAAFAPFGLAIGLFLVMPATTGRQDLAALMAQRPEVVARGRQALIASPFGTIHAAVFSLPQPLGTTIPPPRFMLASYDPNAAVNGATDRDRPQPVAPRPASVDLMVYPTVNRVGKGDRLIPRWGPRPPADEQLTPAPSSAERPLEERDLQQELLDAIARDRAAAARPPAPPVEIDELEAALRFEPFAEYDISLSLEPHPQVPIDLDVAVSDEPDTSIIEDAAKPETAARAARLFFNAVPMTRPGAIEPWADGEEPVLMVPPDPTNADVKQAALDHAAVDPAAAEAGVTVAGKGVVTGEDRRPKSPAAYLGLSGQARANAEKCLSSAIYFEARGESVRGQIAVAQVVLNRAFSGYYPHDVCGVVYQNAHRHLACQFTFACDGRSKAIHEPDAWERAARIAKATLDGSVWLPQVGKATHYHAYWVHPSWVRGMHKLDRIGVHTFYRPRQWGDGADRPSWGTKEAVISLQ